MSPRKTAAPTPVYLAYSAGPPTEGVSGETVIDGVRRRSASQKASVMPLCGAGVLLVMGITEQRPPGTVRCAEEIPAWTPR